MEFRTVGQSGLRVSEIVFGNAYTAGIQTNEGASAACVHKALDVGINAFDTADVYADFEAERILGGALAGQRRESLVLSTKCGWPVGPKGANDGGLSRKHLFESIHGSLRRLRSDYVDIFYAHVADASTSLEETMLAFADIVRAGKALYIGVSWFTAAQIRRAAELAAELRFPLIVNQSQYSMLWRSAEVEIIPTCERLGLSQMVWSPLAQGVLTGKYTPGQAMPEGSRGNVANAALQAILADSALLERVQRLNDLAAELGLTLPQLAIAWVLHQPNVSAAVTGATSPEQIAETARASGVNLSPDVLQRIDAILADSITRDPMRFDY